MLEVDKTFPEKRRIEQVLIRMTPKERYILNKYAKESGIKNVSDWIRNIVFEEIDNKIESGELVLF